MAVRRKTKESNSREDAPDKELTTLFYSLFGLMSPVSIDDTYKKVTIEAMRLCGGVYGSVFLADGKTYKRVYTTHPYLQSIVPRRHGVIDESFRHRKPFVLDAKEGQTGLKRLNVRQILAIPLMHHSDAVGVLTVLCNHKIRYSPRQLHIFNLYGLMASLAILRNRQYDELKTSLELRDLFLAIASHELRTPLTSITTYGYLIEKLAKSHEEIPPELMDNFMAELARFSRLIREILQADKIRKGGMTYEFGRGSVRGVISQAVDSIRQNYPECDIRVTDTLPKNDAISCDREKLVQVFVNIIGNAVKFSYGRSPVTCVMKKFTDAYVISVTDTGKGIGKKDIDRVFEKFFKSENRNEGGMGLGLYLAMEIVRHHKGDIRIKSKLGKGTTVSVYLPVVRV